VSSDGSTVRYNATDGRLVGLLVPADFSDYWDFHPRDGRRSYVTDPGLPLQVVRVKGSPSDSGFNHIHPSLPESGSWPTRHTVFFCIAGLIRVHLSESDATPVGVAEMRPGDALVCTEGHRVEFVENDSKFIEAKQGPYLGEEQDRVLI